MNGLDVQLLTFLVGLFLFIKLPKLIITVKSYYALSKYNIFLIHAIFEAAHATVNSNWARRRHRKGPLAQLFSSKTRHIALYVCVSISLCLDSKHFKFYPFRRGYYAEARIASLISAENRQRHFISDWFVHIYPL